MMHKYGALVSALHSSGQHAAATVIVKLSRQADTVEVMVDALKKARQVFYTHGLSESEECKSVMAALNSYQESVK